MSETISVAKFFSLVLWLPKRNKKENTMPKRIYNPIKAIGFLAMFTFQLDNTKR